MRKGLVGLEYVYLVGIVAAAIIAMLAYIGRGLQGRIRTVSDQIGAGQYEPGKTTVNNREVKHLISTSKSQSATTTKYGDVQSGTDAMQRYQKWQKQFEMELKSLDEIRVNLMGEINRLTSAAEVKDQVSASTVLADIGNDLKKANTEMAGLQAQYYSVGNAIVTNQKDQTDLEQTIADLESQRDAINSEPPCPTVCPAPPPCTPSVTCPPICTPAVNTCAPDDASCSPPAPVCAPNPSCTPAPPVCPPADPCYPDPACEYSKATRLKIINDKLTENNNKLNDLRAKRVVLENQKTELETQMHAKEAAIQAYNDSLGAKTSAPGVDPGSIAALQEALDNVNSKIEVLNKELSLTRGMYEVESDRWAPLPDVTVTSKTTNYEEGTSTTLKNTEEGLGSLQ